MGKDVYLIATSIYDTDDVRAEVKIQRFYGASWEICQNGHIMQVGTSESHNTFRLYAVRSAIVAREKQRDRSRMQARSKGQRTGEFLEVKDGEILYQLATLHTKVLNPNSPRGVPRCIERMRFASTSSPEAGNVFLFVATHSEVEWGLFGVNTERGRHFVVSTLHNTERVSNDIASRFSGFEVRQMFFRIHSHPCPVTGTRGASGCCAIGDIANIRGRLRRFEGYGIPLPPHFVFHRGSSTLYQYTPRVSSKNPRVMRDYNGLNFLTRR